VTFGADFRPIMYDVKIGNGGNGGIRPRVLNDGLYTKPEAARRRWLGLLPGASDLVLVAQNRVVFLEVKAASAVSPEQREFGQQVHTLGHTWAVCRSIDDARRVLAAVGIQMWEVQS
jgi:hypothetical protein